ncbi:SDR family oxidoreductase [Actinophytocola oryzae]|uniref:SDR family oxidoreductase n=1 Tax=Actinophytocola oryzae TaxID=502181 RepID=UPI001414E6ED|nr:SDR family oxidoreductase [Actinophytocola oryzae]
MGGNGFVGMHFLRDLLDDERVEKVYILVRPKGTNSGEARLARQARKYKLALPDTGKLVVLEGSYLDPSMGLDRATYELLLSEVDIVLDAAGATTHEYPYSRYRREKVLPTVTLAEFCLTRRFKTLHVIGSVGSEVYKRRRDFFRGSFFFCGYSKMKFVVKHLSLRLSRDGVPIHIYQAPFALGGPGTAFRDPGMEYSFWNMIWHMVRQGQTWQSGATIPMVASDVLSRAVLNNALSAAPRVISYPVTPVTTAELAERFGLELVSWREFRAKLVRDNRFRLDEVSWRHPVSSTRRALARANFVRSLFPRCLPEILENIDKAATAPATTPLVPGLPAIDVLHANALNIRKLAKELPVTAPETGAVREAA